jgi:hypothetical protein
MEVAAAEEELVGLAVRRREGKHTDGLLLLMMDRGDFSQAKMLKAHLGSQVKMRFSHTISLTNHRHVTP